MGTNHWFGSLCWFVYQLNKCLVLRSPTFCGGRPLGGSILASLHHFLRVLLLIGRLLEEVVLWRVKPLCLANKKTSTNCRVSRSHFCFLSQFWIAGNVWFIALQGTLSHFPYEQDLWLWNDRHYLVVECAMYNQEDQRCSMVLKRNEKFRADRLLGRFLRNKHLRHHNPSILEINKSERKFNMEDACVRNNTDSSPPPGVLLACCLNKSSNIWNVQSLQPSSSSISHGFFGLHLVILAGGEKSSFLLQRCTDLLTTWRQCRVSMYTHTPHKTHPHHLHSQRIVKVKALSSRNDRECGQDHPW